MHEIHGTVMHYPWGTTDAIPGILGVPADGRPHAEYWLGAHPLAPSTLDGEFLDTVLRTDRALLGPEVADAFEGRLPFMMKLLSARHALSLQAHPAKDRALEGFAREEAAGIPLDHAERTFKDPAAKPEILVALTDFELLLGFRNPPQTLQLFEGLGVGDAVGAMLTPLEHRRGTAGTEQVFFEVLSLVDDRHDVIKQLLVAAVDHAQDEGPVGRLARLIIELDEHFPDDPGIMAACLMNHVCLRPGQAAYVPPGTMHADIKGTGVEVLANSDNVIRGGLTNKHIAVHELVSVVDFQDSRPQVLEGFESAPGVRRYSPGCPEFEVWRISGRAEPIDLPAHGAVRIALVTSGNATLTDAERRLDLEHGQALFIPANNTPVRLSGDGEVFLAAPGIA